MSIKLSIKMAALLTLAVWSVGSGICQAQLTISPANFDVTTPDGNYAFAVNGLTSGQTPTNAYVDDSLNFTLNAGATYVFSMDTAFIHPVVIATNADPFSDYVGASEEAVTSGVVTVTIPATNYPPTLYYICNIHFFYGVITIAPPLAPPPLSILNTTVTTSIVLTFSGGTNTIGLVPQFSSNLVSGAWQPVPGYTNTFSGNGTNTTSFERLDAICGPDVFLRISQAPN